jgi:hypothetical protein
MICNRCKEKIPPGEEMDHYGEMLCELCYMQALSPARACDPWAVRSAQTLSEMDDEYSELNQIQLDILEVLRETGGVEAFVIAQKLGIKLSELERELATLRHMEKTRGEMRAGKKIVCLW